MYSDYYDGVYFVEGSPAGARSIRPISTTLNGCWFSQSQLKSLDDIKSVMAREALQHGGNAVINFKYCQKSSFWRSLLSIDDVRWESSGTIAIINPASLN